MMKNILLLILVCMSFKTYAQTKFNYGIELGLNRNNLTGGNHYSGNSIATFKNRIRHVEDRFQVSCGLKLIKPYKKHFSFNLNVNFKKLHQYFAVIENIDDLNYGGYIYIFDEMKFSKLTGLLSVQYNFGKRNGLGVFVGVEPNFFLKGFGSVYYYQGFWNDSGISHYTQARHLGFYKESYQTSLSHYYKLRRFQPQFALGISKPLLKHFQINAAAHLGLVLLEDDVTTYLRNNDFTLSLSYFFKRLYDEKPSAFPME